MRTASKPLVAADRGLGADLVAVGGAALLVTAAAVVGARLLDESVPLAVAVAARRIAPLLVAGAAVAGVVIAFAAAGFWWLNGYQQVTIRYYQPGEYGLVRPYSYWLWANLACLAVVLGPAGIAGLRRAFAPGELAAVEDVPGRGWWYLKSPQLMCGAAAIAVLTADLSGLSKAEVERIWLPFAV